MQLYTLTIHTTSARDHQNQMLSMETWQSFAFRHLTLFRAHVEQGRTSCLHNGLDPGPFLCLLARISKDLTGTVWWLVVIKKILFKHKDLKKRLFPWSISDKPEDCIKLHARPRPLLDHSLLGAGGGTAFGFHGAPAATAMLRSCHTSTASTWSREGHKMSTSIDQIQYIIWLGLDFRPPSGHIPLESCWHFRYKHDSVGKLPPKSDTESRNKWFGIKRISLTMNQHVLKLCPHPTWQCGMKHSKIPTGQLYIHNSNPFNHNWDLTTARVHNLTAPSSASSMSTRLVATNPACWTMHSLIFNCSIKSRTHRLSIIG